MHENIEEYVPFEVQEYNLIFKKLCLHVMLKNLLKDENIEKTLCPFPTHIFLTSLL